MNRASALPLVIVSFFAGGGVGNAQEACTKISDPISRLTCYDQWAGKELGAIIISDSLPPGVVTADTANAAKEALAAAEPATEASEPATKTTGNWVLSVNKSAMEDTTDAIADISAGENVQCASFGEASPIHLTLRCMENTTAMMIGGNCHLASGFQGYGKVTYRLGDSKAKSRNFEVSTDNTVLGLWNGGSAIPMIKEMLGNEKMIVRFTPFSMSPVEVEFDISGIDNAVADIRKSCAW